MIGQGKLAVLAAVVVCVLALALKWQMAERAADHARTRVVKIDAARRGEAIRADTGASVAVHTDQAASEQVRVERVTSTVIREIEASPDASTPIPPDLARAWVAGLRGVCDAAGPDACIAAADRIDRPAGVEPVSSGDAPRGGRADRGRGDGLRG